MIGFFRIVTSVDRPLCTCGAHVIWSRHRFAMLNDRPRSQAFKQTLKQVINIFMANHIHVTNIDVGRHTFTYLFMHIKHVAVYLAIFFTFSNHINLYYS